MEIESDPVEDALRLCGITSKNTIDCVKAEGFESLNDFGHLFTEKHVEQFMESIKSRNSGAQMSYMSARKLRGLALWVRKRGPHSATIQSLTATILDEACRDMDSAHAMEHTIPSHYKTADLDMGLGWFNWKNRILHKLRTMSSAMGGTVTINYVVRPNRTPDRGPWNQEDYMVSLDNEYFRADNKTVALFLTDVLMDTAIYVVVREALNNNNGRKAWLRLVDEAESKERAQQRYESVSKQVAQVKYTGNEAVYPFHEYVTKLRMYFDMLDENGKNYRFENSEKVSYFLDQIKMRQPAIQEEIGKLKESPLRFDQCVQKMSRIIDEHRNLLPEKSPQVNGTTRERKRRRSM